MHETYPPSPRPCRHTCAELHRLTGDLRRLAYDPDLADDDRARRIRDRFGVFDGIIDDE